MTVSEETQKGMKVVTLTHKTATGDCYQATFAPSAGMNLQSFSLNGIEVMDTSTRPLFDERFAGLGALIGPHFHRRNPSILPTIQNESAFPHIERVKAKGTMDPFSHGIARYTPWSFTSQEASIEASLNSQDEWNGARISDLQGFIFNMSYTASLTDEGLKLRLAVTSESECLVGLHFYYRLPNGQGSVLSDVHGEYRDVSEWKPIPEEWGYQQNQLEWDLSRAADYGFQSFYNSCGGEIHLKTSEYKLKTAFNTPHAEQSWQLYHPENASFVCIEPMTARDPRKPILTASILEVCLSIHQP